jgi:hypothetical protein
MATPYLELTLLLVVPVAVFAGGAWTMSTVSGRHTVSNQKPLNHRLGYDTNAVDRYWGGLDLPGRLAEQRFLELDLVFPVLYGTALAVSLLTASAMLHGRIHAAWLIAPVVVTVVADWVENLVQLAQLQNYIESGKKGLAAGWIHLASAATIVKLVFFSISSLAVLALGLTLLLSPWTAQ